MWQKAAKENPDPGWYVRAVCRRAFSYLTTHPSSLVPVVANGFDDLQKRVEAQTQQAGMHQERLKVGVSDFPIS